MSESHGTGHRILVADDEENTRDLLSTALRFVGFEVDLAVDGDDALHRATSGRFDLMVLDVMMPGRDGFEVLRRMQADGITTPVIFLTARDTTEDKLSGFTKGRRRLRHEALQPRRGPREGVCCAGPLRRRGQPHHPTPICRPRARRGRSPRVA